MTELLRYEKLASELAGMIADGALRPGDGRPSVRRSSAGRRLAVATLLQALIAV